MFKRYWKQLAVLLVLLAALPAGVYLATNQTRFFGLAGPETVPQQVKITNISDNSFTVSWMTPGKAISGFVSYGNDEKLGSSARDDRDKDKQSLAFQDKDKTQDRLAHHVTLKNLDPGTIYYFRVGSGNKLYDDNGAAYQQKTAPTTDDPPVVADPAFGKVTSPGGVVVEGALVYLTMARGTPLSSYTRSDGNYLVTLNNARTADLSTYITYKAEGDSMDIFIASPAGTARATTDTNNDSPLPNITLGQTHKFGTLGSKPTMVATSSGTTASEFSLQPVEKIKESDITPTITNPKLGDTVNQTRPIFSGTGQPGEIIMITIESPQTITAQVAVGQDGTWSYTPGQDLTGGSHKITVAQGSKTSSSTFKVLGAVTSPTPKAASVSALPQAGTSNVTLIILLSGIIILLSGLYLFKKFLLNGP